MRINHNIAALNTYRQLSANGTQTQNSLEKLSSGLRINKAGDDAAGLAISEKMRGQIRGLEMAQRNSQDAISMVQTAEGALNETHSILQRMRELAVQSANGTNADSDRKSIQDEINQLADELNRIGNTTEFNTQKLINGSKDKTEAAAAVKNASSIAKIGAGDDLFEVRDTATAGTAVGSNMTGAITIHDGTSGKYTSGISVTANGTGTTLSDAVTANTNELTIQIGNAVRTITLDDTAASDAAVAADIEGKLQTAFASAYVLSGTDSGTYHGDNTDAGNIDVSISGGALVITDGGKGADSKISIVGGNAASALFNSNDVAENGNAANNTMTVNYTKDNGATTITAELTVANNTYADSSAMAAAIESAFNDWASSQDGIDAGASADDVDFSGVVGLPGAISVTTDTDNAGRDNGVTSFAGAVAGLSGLSDATIALGKAKNDELNVSVDGNTYNVTLAAQDYADKDILATAIQSAVNTEIQTWNNGNPSLPQRELVEVKALSVADTDRVRYQITSGKTGATSEITFGNTALASDLGFNTVQEKGQAGSDASLSYQIGANSGQNLSLAMGDMRAEALGITSTSNGAGTITDGSGEVHDVSYGSNTVKNGTATEYIIDVSNEESADEAITVVNNAIELVSQERSKLGATQNRLEHTINNLGTTAENLTASESRIRDVDMAKEMMEFTKNNILSQAAQAMLAQANQQPQGVLQLLR